MPMATLIGAHKATILWLQLHGGIYRPDSFVLVLRYCANLKAIRYESTSFSGILADESHRVNVASEVSNYFSKVWQRQRLLVYAKLSLL